MIGFLSDKVIFGHLTTTGFRLSVSYMYTVPNVLSVPQSDRLRATPACVCCLFSDAVRLYYLV